MRRRVVDMAGILPGVQVTFNGEPLPISSFRDFAQCFLPAASSPLHYVRVNKRLEVAVAPAEEGQQVSFVNGMSTPRGGTHVDVIVEQVARKLAEAAAKRAGMWCRRCCRCCRCSCNPTLTPAARPQRCASLRRKRGGGWQCS